MCPTFQPVRLKVVEREWATVEETSKAAPQINLLAIALMWPVVAFAGWLLFTSRLGSRIVAWR